jgi:hypothetical protein
LEFWIVIGERVEVRQAMAVLATLLGLVVTPAFLTARVLLKQGHE